jgi:hypothetical protein
VAGPRAVVSAAAGRPPSAPCSGPPAGTARQHPPSREPSPARSCACPAPASDRGRPALLLRFPPATSANRAHRAPRIVWNEASAGYTVFRPPPRRPTPTQERNAVQALRVTASRCIPSLNPSRGTRKHFPIQVTQFHNTEQHHAPTVSRPVRIDVSRDADFEHELWTRRAGFCDLRGRYLRIGRFCGAGGRDGCCQRWVGGSVRLHAELGGQRSDQL